MTARSNNNAALISYNFSNGSIAPFDGEKQSRKNSILFGYFYKNFIQKILDKMTNGSLTVVCPDGNILKTRNTIAAKQLSQKIYIHSYRSLRRLFFSGILGFCESYIDAEWSCENITIFYTIVMLNENALQDDIFGTVLLRRFNNLLHRFNRNTRKQAKKNISFHYDLGNDFYQLWLDPSMTYSSAYFQGNYQTDLQTAQHQKYDAILQKMDVKKGDHILEIGCGWGGFAEYAVQNYQSKLTGLTISQKQFDFAKKRLAQEIANQDVDIKFMDYRDLKGKQFDHIVSIEMFEAVGEEYWNFYFETISKSLRKNGKAVLQIITIDKKYFTDYRKTADYIQRYIFPGGMLPTEELLHDHCKNNGLTITETDRFGLDYTQTLLLWNKQFQQQWPAIEKIGFDTKFKRIWEMYFAYCAAGFATKNIDVIQITIEHQK